MTAETMYSTVLSNKFFSEEVSYKFTVLYL